jgi:hypothetical protein
MAAGIYTSAIIAGTLHRSRGDRKAGAEPDSGDRRHTVFEEPKDINSTSDPEWVSIALIHAACAGL